MKSYQQTTDLLDTLKLKGIASHLDELITDAERQKHSYISFVNALFQAEITDRRLRRLRRNLSAAHFPIEKRLEQFEFGKVTGIGKSEVANLAECGWIDRRENLLFFGPPGVGKTHLAIGLGLTAIDRGYTVCFERVNSLMRLLKTAPIQRSSEFRLRRILRSSLLIIDEIGYTPIDRKEANHFFGLVSELYEKSSIVITSNKSFDDWAEMLGDEVMTTAMLDRLLHHAQIFTLDGDSYRLKDKTKNKEETDPPKHP
jgi:DNA replication protein DnaC